MVSHGLVTMWRLTKIPNAIWYPGTMLRSYYSYTPSLWHLGPVPIPVPMVPIPMVPYPYPYPYLWSRTHTRTHDFVTCRTHTRTHGLVSVPVPIPMVSNPYPYPWPRTHTRTHDPYPHYKSATNKTTLSQSIKKTLKNGADDSKASLVSSHCYLMLVAWHLNSRDCGRI